MLKQWSSIRLKYIDNGEQVLCNQSPFKTSHQAGNHLHPTDDVPVFLISLLRLLFVLPVHILVHNSSGTAAPALLVTPPNPSVPNSITHPRLRISPASRSIDLAPVAQIMMAMMMAVGAKTGRGAADGRAIGARVDRWRRIGKGARLWEAIRRQRRGSWGPSSGWWRCWTSWI